MSDRLADVTLRFKLFPKSGNSAAFTDDDSEEPIFLPLSQIEIEPPDPARGQLVVVTMPEWLATEKGLV